MEKKLRSGYTTGACAAAAAKAAVLLLLDEQCQQANVGARRALPLQVEYVEIPFPDGSRHTFKINNSGFKTEGGERTVSASVIKDAGDDPDVTNGAEIVAEATLVRKRGSGKARKQNTSGLAIKGGKGVGIVTKPGLSVPIGEAAINPVPRKMIEEAVAEAAGARSSRPYCTDKACLASAIKITISVPDGEELAKKTLNHRLGIVGGISILGTTGIVKPVSTEAWTATIASSMSVARASGCKEVVVSAGRTSEKAHMKEYGFPEEAYVLMGDHLEFSLREARRHGFEKIYLCAQWAKMVKIAMATPQTHVRFGAIDIKKAVDFLNSIGIRVPHDRDFNTAREIFDWIISGREAEAIHALRLRKICEAAGKYAEGITRGVRVSACLVSYEGKIIAAGE